MLVLICGLQDPAILMVMLYRPFSMYIHVQAQLWQTGDLCILHGRTE